jgi:opacity protein-like surface antigen
MTTSFKIVCATLMVGAVLCAQSACADSDSLDGLFLGGSFGRARNEFNTVSVEDQFVGEAKSAGDTLKYTGSSVHRDSNAWWVDAGYMPWMHFGVDAAFLHLGELSSHATGSLKIPGVGTDSVLSTAKITSRGPALAVLFRLPLAEHWDVDFRLGDYLGKSTETSGIFFKKVSQTTPESSSASSLLAGVGSAYTFLGHWSVRLDYIRVDHAGNSDTGKFNVNLASLGVRFTF